jgi:hypothetical protein
MSFSPLHLLLLVSLLWLASCATKKDTEFLEIDSDNVEQTLDIDKKKLNKFTVKKPKKQPPKKLKKAVVKKEAIPEKKSERPKTVERKPQVKKKKDSLISYPGDEKYPKVFKEYDISSAGVWKAFKPVVEVGEKFTFKVGFLGLTVGHIQMETLPDAEINEEEVFHFKARMRSARYYSYIYTLDDSIESYVSKKSFTPLKYLLLQRESGQTVDDLQLFDRDELKTYHFYKRLKKGKRKKNELEKPIPFYFQDSYSALHFVRGLPFNIGDKYKFPIVTRGKIWILDIFVEKIETIEVNGKDVKAYRLNAETRFPGVLEKKGDILFWYSADDQKKLMKFEAEVKIGSVSGELVEYSRGK